MAASRNESMLAYFEVSMPVGNAWEITVFPRRSIDTKKRQRHPWIDLLRFIDRDRETALDRL